MSSSTVLPLSGIRVLEFSQTIMGPSAGLILADLGAEVFKIEPVPDGDKTRRMPGFAAGFFGAFNRNKKSVAIDLKSRGGQDIVQRLVKLADVLIENYAPGTMSRLGCGYEQLAEVNPRLVYCALKGFLSGPYEHRPALDEVVQFMGGLAYMTGPPGRPLRAGSSIIDIMGGTMAVVAVLSALRERERTGRGQLVKSALFENTVFLMAQHMVGSSITGMPVPPMPARESAWAIYELFDTAGGDPLFIGITSDNHWRLFCERFGRQDLLEDARYGSNEDRVRERPTLVPIVAEIVKRHEKQEMIAICEEIGIPFAPVATTEDLFDDPHLNAGGRLVEVELPGGIRTRLPKLPIEMGHHDFTLRMQPPALGEHTREVLAGIGLSEMEISHLEAEGVVKCAAPPSAVD